MGFGTIQEFTARRKAFLEEGVGDWGLYIAICLLALAAFGLGRISALQGSRPPISVTQAAAAAASLGMYPGGQIIIDKRRNLLLSVVLGSYKDQGG